MIHRRKLLKQFVFVGAGIAIIPSCLSDKSKSSILLKKINVSGDDEQMLAELCESILPKTTTPGAKDISAHLFVLKMVDDCMSKEDQDTFIGGLTAFNDFSKTITGKYFRDCHFSERAIVLKQLIAIKDDTTNLAAFFKIVKRYTIQAYTGSEFFLTRVQVYELIPGRYHGCVPA